MTKPAVPRERLALWVFGILSLVLLWAAWKILFPFITSILLAAIIVTFTYPIYRRVRERFKGREGAAAWVMLVLITVVLVIPAFVMTFMLIEEAQALFRMMEKADYGQMLQKVRVGDRLVWVKKYVPNFDPSRVQPEAIVVTIVKRIPALVATHGGRFVAGLTQAVIGFFMMLLAAYYFYVEGERLTKEIKFLSPLPDRYDTEIFEKFRGVVDATFRGQILTALTQGVVTAIGLAIVGIPGSIFWGAVAALFSLIPMVGAATVWVPATAYLFLAASFGEGAMWKPIVLAIWGLGVVSVVDNLIRPWAMRGGTNMSAIILFFSILGGIQAFGFVGLILGPLVFALLVTVISIYKTVFKETLAAQNR